MSKYQKAVEMDRKLEMINKFDDKRQASARRLQIEHDIILIE